MELKHFYRTMFTNGQEFVIETEIESTNELIEEFGANKRLFHSGLGFIALQLKDGEPVFIAREQLFSVQKINAASIGGQTKLWRMK